MTDPDGPEPLLLALEDRARSLDAARRKLEHSEATVQRVSLQVRRLDAVLRRIELRTGPLRPSS